MHILSPVWYARFFGITIGCTHKQKVLEEKRKENISRVFLLELLRVQDQ